MVLQKGKGKGFTARDCISGKLIDYKEDFTLSPHKESINGDEDNMPFVGPGLIDIQINGVKGVDFNVNTLNGEELLFAAKFLLSKGVTTFFPTIITNSVKNINQILSVINEACIKYPLLDQCVGGIHLEGPFISASDGYRGAHKKRYVRAPDWELFCYFQNSSGNRIKIISLAPEWDNSSEFISKCKNENLIVGIAHSRADANQISAAVNSGACLSTHLGNSVPVMLPRHPNIIWDQLAEERLLASIVADGFHLPDSFIRVVLKVKQDKTILVSDATNFSGLPPGVYETHIGKEVVLEKGGRLSMKGQNGLLAGATKLLSENVQYLLSNDLADLSTAWNMASAGPAILLGNRNISITSGKGNDLVFFKIMDGSIIISEVIKNGKSVWKSGEQV